MRKKIKKNFTVRKDYYREKPNNCWRASEPDEDAEKSIGASCEINLRDSSSLSPSGRLEKEWVLPWDVNFTAKGKDQRYLMSLCDRTERSGFRVLRLWIVDGAKSAKIWIWCPLCCSLGFWRDCRMTSSLIEKSAVSQLCLWVNYLVWGVQELCVPCLIRGVEWGY